MRPRRGGRGDDRGRDDGRGETTSERKHTREEAATAVLLVAVWFALTLTVTDLSVSCRDGSNTFTKYFSYKIQSILLKSSSNTFLNYLATNAKYKIHFENH